MSFMQKLRISADNQPPPITEKKFKFAPRWLAENQRTALRVACTLALGSFMLNGYQFYLREQLPERPPETFAAVFAPDMTEMQVISTRKLKQTDMELAAKAIVRRLVYQLRRVDSSASVQENIDTLYCTVAGEAADKADASFKRGKTPDLLRKGLKRVMFQEAVRVDKRPGEKWRDNGMLLQASWTETVHEGARAEQAPMSAEFKMERFDHIDNKIRDCNVLGIMVTDYEMPE